MYIYETQVIGIGVSALGIILAFDRVGKVDRLMRNFVFIEKKSRREYNGNPSLNYSIMSNSPGIEFVESVYEDGIFKDIVNSNLFKSVKNCTSNPIELTKYSALARSMVNRYYEYSASLGFFNPIIYNYDIAEVIRCDNGDFVSYDMNGNSVAKSKNIIFASGAKQRDFDDISGNHGVPEGTKIIESEIFLRNNFIDTDSVQDSNVCVLGGSHSGFSCVRKLLQVGCDKITLVHKNDILLYELVDKKVIQCDNVVNIDMDAIRQNLHINRFNGLRHDSKKLYNSIKNEQVNVDLVRLKDVGDKFYEDKNIVINATGYTSNIPSIVDFDGTVLLRANSKVEVSEEGRLLSNKKMIDENIYGIGMVSPKRTILGAQRVGVNIFHNEDTVSLLNSLYGSKNNSKYNNMFFPCGEING